MLIHTQFDLAVRIVYGGSNVQWNTVFILRTHTSVTLRLESGYIETVLAENAYGLSATGDDDTGRRNMLAADNHIAPGKRLNALAIIPPTRIAKLISKNVTARAFR